MGYIKQNFVKGQTLKAEHLNHMEDGIVKASTIPTTTSSHSMIVTDGDGKTTWVNRTHYSDITETEIFTQADIAVEKHPALSCYWKQNLFDVVLIDNEVYTIYFNETEYKCIPYQDASGFKYLGNPSIWEDDANTGNNEPFAIRFVGTSGYLIVPREGIYNLRIIGPVETYYKISGDYTGFYSNDIDAINTNKSKVGSGGKNSFGLYGYAMGESSFAHGNGSTAIGESSVALNGSIAYGKFQFTHGVSNVVDTAGKYLHIIGNGITGRSNAHTLDWNGNAEFAGDVIANGCGGESPISITNLANRVEVKTIQIIDGTAMAPNMVQNNSGYEVSEIVDLLRDTTRYEVVFNRMIMAADSSGTEVRKSTGFKVVNVGDGTYNAIVYFGSDLAPITFNSAENKLTLG